MKKAEANYRLGDEAASCGTCANFLAPDKCSVVEGTIASEGLCDVYTPVELGGMEQGQGEMASTPSQENLMSMLFGGPA